MSQNTPQDPISLDNSNALMDLIQSIQTKMNTGNNNTNIENNNETNVKSEDNNTYESNSSNTKYNNQGFDLSSLSSLLGNVDLTSILSAFTGNKTNNDSSFNLGDIDPNTIHKFQKILTSMNRDSPKKNLLLSLKPFLRKSRQDKIGEYMTMLTVADAIEIFGSKGSD